MRVLLHAQNFISGAMASTIRDNGYPYFAKVNVSGLPPITGSNFGLESICLDITHSYDAQLDIYLISPNGVRVEISTNNGGDGHSYLGTCFNSTSTDFISSAFSMPPFKGSFRPEGDLSDFNNGSNPNGVWKLYIVDEISDQYKGILNNWSLSFSSNPAKRFKFTSSNLPIVVLNTKGKPIGDHVKIVSKMHIVDNSPGKRNSITGPYNNYDGYVNIHIHGSSSKLFPKKSFSIETIKDSASDISLNYGLVDLPADNDWVLKSSYVDKSLIRDVVVFSLFGVMHRYSVKTRLVEVVLNNQYLGVYQLEEKVKQGRNRISVTKITPADISGDALTGGYIFSLNREKNNDYGWFSKYPSNIGQDSSNYFIGIYPSAKNIVRQQKKYIHAVVDSFERSLMQPDFSDLKNGYRRWIDVNSFIDNFIINELTKNADGYRLSTYFYKDRDSENKKIIMGPIWDFDISCGNSKENGGRDPIGWQFQNPSSEHFVPFWWARFMQDPVFKKQLIARYLELRKTALDFKLIIKLIDKNVSLLHEAQERNFKQWPILGKNVWPNPLPTGATYQDEVSYLKQWFKDRLTWMDSNILKL